MNETAKRRRWLPKEAWRKFRHGIRKQLGRWQSWEGIAHPPFPRARVAFDQWKGRSKRRAVVRGVVAASHTVYEASPLLDPHPVFRGAAWQRNEARFPALSVIEVPTGRTAGKRGAVITDDNVLLAELSELPWDCHDGVHPLLRGCDYPSSSRVIRKKGVYGLAHSVENSTYHWLYETLPRLELLRMAGYTWETLDGIFIRKPRYEPHLATLDLLGIPPEKIVWCKSGTHFAADTIVSAPIPTVACFHSAWVHPFLRSLPGELPLSLPKKQRRRLLVSRGEPGTSRRRVVNQEAVTMALESLGFEEVQLGPLPFVEQARLFASAEWIVAPHGAALANLVFAPKGAKVIEIFTPDYAPVMFRNLAWEVGLCYQPMMADPVETGELCLLGRDMTVDPGALHALFCRMEAACGS